MAKAPAKGGSLAERMKAAAKTPYAVLMGVDEDKFAVNEYLDTGNVLFNALVSADPYKGVPAGKIIQLAGPASTGKTYFCLELVKSAQAAGYFVVLYDSEFANNDKADLVRRGIDPNMLLWVGIDTVESLKTAVLNQLDEINLGEKVAIMIDSIGNLSTSKEINDTTEGKEVRDMTRAQQLKALFRTCTLRAGVKGVPMFIVNHVYACGTEKMEVMMSDGSVKSLKDVAIGEFVKTLQGDKEVLDVHSYNDAEVSEIELTDGTILEFTANHKLMVLTDEGDMIWKRVEDLLVTDKIVKEIVYS